MLPDNPCVTWSAGSNAVRLTDWSPLTGRVVVIWPDADAPGLKAAAEIADALCGIAKKLLFVDTTGLADGFDAADLETPDPAAWLRERMRDEAPGAVVEASVEPAPAVRTATPSDPRPPAVPHPADKAAGDFVPPEFADEALALRFAERHASDLRYVAAWSRWFFWDGTRWKADDTLRAFDLARAICREAAAECAAVQKPSVAVSVASAKTVAAVERLARSDRRLAATVDQWDRDPWSLNTPAGVVDLRTGITRPARRDEHMTKVTAVAPGGDCPTWRTFLNEATAGDVDLQLYLQRVAGYTLTGITREHALFFFYGTGGNGKGTYLNALTGIVADYAAIAGMEAFTASTSDRHPTDLAALRGARLVTAQETEEGRRWAEAKIKALTGGDPITARFMRCDFFTYVPQFKLAIAGNHKPGLRAVDEAIRRRFHLVPFTVTIPADRRDPDLPEKLKAEWPGILQWAIDGCVAWLEAGGLHPPPAVMAATDDYLDAEDAFGQWLGECCERRAGAWSASSALYSSWKTWADAAGEFAGSQKRFSQNLANRGFVPRRGQVGHAGFDDIRITAAPDHAASREHHDEWK